MRFSLRIAHRRLQSSAGSSFGMQSSYCTTVQIPRFVFAQYRFCFPLSATEESRSFFGRRFPRGALVSCGDTLRGSILPYFAMPREVPAQHCSDAWGCFSRPIWDGHAGASKGNPIIAAVEMLSGQNCRGIVTTLFLSVLVLLLFGSWQSSASVVLHHFGGKNGISITSMCCA